VFSAGNDPNGRGQRAIKAVPATGVITGSAAPPTRPRGSRPAARSTPRSRPHLPASRQKRGLLLILEAVVKTLFPDLLEQIIPLIIPLIVPRIRPTTKLASAESQR